MTRIPRLATLTAIAGLFVLTGCKPEQAQESSPVRPVLSVVITPNTDQSVGFTGTVEPRYTTDLGFRDLGRLIARTVEVGDQVNAGAVLAAIDPLQLQLAVRSAIADVATARARLKNTSSAESRQGILLNQGVTPQSQYDSAQLARETATASVRSAEANLGKAQEQLKYATLRCDTNGVVTAVSGQVGQVVQPGQAVVTIARPDVREASIDVPENISSDLRQGVAFDIALELDPSIHMRGEVREIAPEADAATRTHRVRIAIPDASDVFRLGTTIIATLITPHIAGIDLPRSALLEHDGKVQVWVVDPKSAIVTTRDVLVSQRNDTEIRVTGGLTDGDRVVIAGVHSLTLGQHVKLPDRTAS